MSERLVWERDGRDWPNRAASRFVRADGFMWHVQVSGQGPVALLLHGTGAATHSWRGVWPLLTEHFTVVAPDLPGHGFTQSPPAGGLSLPGMARGVAALLRSLDLSPQLAVGHSAGAAILARMALDGLITPRALVSLNGALLPLFGLAGQVFSGVAKVMVGVPLLPRLFAWRASDPQVVQGLLRGTGSTIDATGAGFYRRLAGNPAHAGAALGMMANWDLQPLLRDLPKLQPALTLVVGGNDRTISPNEAVRVRNVVPGARIVTLPRLGHLAHEEQPRSTADAILTASGEAGVLA